MKRALVLGASPNPDRYSYLALNLLLDHHFHVQGIGRQAFKHRDMIFVESPTEIDVPIDLITLYLSKDIQPKYYDFIISLKPKLVIFNPGTENPLLQQLLSAQNISWEEACTLVLLNSNQLRIQ
ncbi:MAG: CoA-binding protein [Chitinophagales bacterium]|jgi:hypothetical protein|nr:CoA-binding protein [Chitinophagales bacterium]